MAILYRAVVDSPRHTQGLSDTIVFFEAEPSQMRPGDRLSHLLIAMWGVRDHDLEIYNVNSEFELLAQAFGDADDGDKRLFETGWSDGHPAYAKPDSTLFLVGPRTLQRLVSAQPQGRSA